MIKRLRRTIRHKSNNNTDYPVSRKTAHNNFREVKIEMTNRDDTPKTRDTGHGTRDGNNQHSDAPHDSPLPVALPFGASTDAPLEDLPVPGDSHSKHSYYYDDATNYKVFNPDEDEE